jgi:hypothetical protein
MSDLLDAALANIVKKLEISEATFIMEDIENK